MQNGYPVVPTTMTRSPGEVRAPPPSQDESARIAMTRQHTPRGRCGQPSDGSREGHVAGEGCWRHGAGRPQRSGSAPKAPLGLCWVSGGSSARGTRPPPRSAATSPWAVTPGDAGAGQINPSGGTT